MSRRRRPHPARRARRVAGATALGAYAGLVVTVGWAQRSAETGGESAEPAADTVPSTPGIERLDLQAGATLWAAETPTPTADAPAVAPTPPPPPSLAVTTTTTIRRVVPPPTTPPSSTAPPATATSSSTVPPPPTTEPPAPSTTTTVAPTTTPPPTTIPTGGS